MGPKAVGLGQGARQSYQAVILADGPVVYLRLGEGSGNIADSTGNGFASTSSGGTPQYGQAGAIAGDPNTAINFVRNNGTYFLIPVAANSLLDIESGPVTIEAWINLTALGDVSTIFSRGVSGSTGYQLQVDAANLLHLGNMGGGNYAANTALGTGVWHYAVGITNGASSAIYLDGVRNDSGGTVNIAGVGGSNPAAVGAVFNNAGGANPGQFFPGLIDEVAVYAKALTSAQIARHYKVGIG